MAAKVKKKSHKTADPTWDTVTYGNSLKSPFRIEWQKYYNPVEGRDQVLFLYSDKKTGNIVKYRILR
tara:strand:- start:100 stop:300 length:201 start_codon:yes stop_codon:yes gene_type:complete